MNTTNNSIYTRLLTGTLALFCLLGATAAEPAKNNKKTTANWNREVVMDYSRRAADWQIELLPTNKYAIQEPKGWVPAAFYMVLFDWAELSQDKKYFDWMRKTFGRESWQVADRMYHADDVCVAQTYIDLYNKYNDPRMLKPTLARAEWVINNPSNGSMDLDYSDGSTIERWTWCDALFMAPPMYSRLYALTGNRKYMHFADNEFRATYNYLYDKDEHLFYRDSRYFDQREANGKKIFWGRGNGWVIGGLAELLKTLPEADKEYRPFYQQLFVEMCESLAPLQGNDGYWHASLLDPASYPSPETSATGFIVYGLAYGVNQGYLDAETYLPVIQRGWAALTDAVEADGKLGWVQPVGADPKQVTREMTELYGVGAFLMAAAEVYQLTK